MHLEKIEDYSFDHGLHLNAVTGEYSSLNPHTLGRPLTHTEMDYNLLYQKQTLMGFRIVGSNSDLTLNSSDLGRILELGTISNTSPSYGTYIAAGLFDSQQVWFPVEMAAPGTTTTTLAPTTTTTQAPTTTTTTTQTPTTTTTTLATFDCNDAGLVIPDGDEGEAVTGTVTAGTLDNNSFNPAVYTLGISQYTADITVPAGYTNSGVTLSCSDNATTTPTPLWGISSGSAVNEGVTLTFAVQHAFVPAGTNYTWNTTGTTQTPAIDADFDPAGFPSGSGTTVAYQLTLANETYPTGHYDITIDADQLTEVNEYFTIHLLDENGIEVASKEIRIDDTSQNPTTTTTLAPTTTTTTTAAPTTTTTAAPTTTTTAAPTTTTTTAAPTTTTTLATFDCNDAGLVIPDGDEGEAVTGTLSGLGTLDNSSFNPAVYTLGITQYSADITVPAGYTNSGATLSCSDNATVTPTPIYTILASPSQVEQSTLTAELYTQYVTAGTVYTWEVVGHGANPATAADFNGGVFPSGSGTIPTYNTAFNQSDTFDIYVIPDNTTEGVEQYKIIVKVGGVLKDDAIVNITDTSQDPTTTTTTAAPTTTTTAAPVLGYWFHGGAQSYPFTQDGNGLTAGGNQTLYWDNGLTGGEFTDTTDISVAMSYIMDNAGTSYSPGNYTVSSFTIPGGDLTNLGNSDILNFAGTDQTEYYYIVLPDGQPDVTTTPNLYNLNGGANTTAAQRIQFTWNGNDYWLYRLGFAPASGINAIAFSEND